MSISSGGKRAFMYGSDASRIFSDESCSEKSSTGCIYISQHHGMEHLSRESICRLLLTNAVVNGMECGGEVIAAS